MNRTWLKKRLGLGLAALLAASVVIAGCGGKTEDKKDVGGTPAGGAQTTKASGAITLYTSESQDQVNEMKADFEAAYPGVTLNIFRSGTGEVIAKLKTEMEANQVQADLIWFADYAYFQANEGKLLAYESAEAKSVDSKYKYGGNKFVEVRTIYNVIGYNTKAVTTPPTSWKDLQNPAYKGKVGMASPAYSGAAFSTMGTLVNVNGLGGWDFYKGLKANETKVEKGNGGVQTKLATGEYAMGSIVDFMVRNAKKDGSPVDYILPAEGAVLVPTPIAIMSSSKNPDAAKAFIDYLYSERGQKLFVKQGYQAVKAGVGAPPGTHDMTNAKVLIPDFNWIEKNRESMTTEYNSIFPQ